MIPPVPRGILHANCWPRCWGCPTCTRRQEAHAPEDISTPDEDADDDLDDDLDDRRTMIGDHFHLGDSTIFLLLYRDGIERELACTERFKLASWLHEGKWPPSETCDAPDVWWTPEANARWRPESRAHSC